MPESKTIVVIGGTGHFGGRICRRLVGEPGTELIATSRSKAHAASLVSKLRAECPEAHIRSASLDQFSPTFVDDLRKLNPDIVIHTAGPYQGQDYTVARACIDCKSHYIDLADGREFVQDFNILNEEAQRKGVLLVSGASTLPGLSSAVVDSLRGRFRQITDIEISIAPAHQTPRGTGTMAAVLSYCGKPFQVLCDGEWVTKHGWQNIRIQHYPAFGRRLAGACDVPDLSLLPAYVAGSRTVTFHAALEAPWEHLTLWVMGWLIRFGIVNGWSRFLPAFGWLSDRLIGLGSDMGGMHIRLSGTDDNRMKKVCTWYLTARANHGPEIPCSPALILARKLVRGEVSKLGAHACLGLITLSQFDAEVKDLDISWEVVE